MQMPNRHESDVEYRYGFQGQEGDDEIKGEGNSVNYRYRMHDPRLGRFFKLDPLSYTYPHNSPYAFSENRVIDGIEFEGLEYITKEIKVHADGTGTLMNITDYRGIAEFNYSQYSESFGPEGRGIKYIYNYVDENDKVIRTEIEWEISQRDGLTSRIGRHGLFMGSGSITRGGPLYPPPSHGNEYDFTENPIDGVDAAAKKHDMAHAAIDNYQGWLEDNRTLASDKELLKDFEDYIHSHKLKLAAGVTKDQYTGRAASQEAITSAKTGKIMFNIVINYKEWKVGQLQSMGLDPYDVNNQHKVTLKDYEPQKWYQLKRKIEYKILKSASENTPK